MCRIYLAMSERRGAGSIGVNLPRSWSAAPATTVRSRQLGGPRCSLTFAAKAVAVMIGVVYQVADCLASTPDVRAALSGFVSIGTSMPPRHNATRIARRK